MSNLIDIPDIQKDLELTKNKIRALQSETVHCITIKPTGKIEVVDKGKLEELNSEADRLAALSSGNEAVLTRLLELTGGKPLADVQLSKRRLDGHIQKVKGCLSSDLGELLKRNPGLDVDGLSANPKAAKLQADAKSAIAGNTPELERLTALLTQADEILQAFQPSGLKEAVPRYSTFNGGF